MKENIKQLLIKFNERTGIEHILVMYSDGTGFLDKETKGIIEFDDEAELINILKG